MSSAQILQPRLSAFLCLRWPVLVAFLVSWNGLWLIGLWLNAWSRRPATGAATVVAVTMLAGTAVLALSLAYNTSFARRVIDPSRAERFHRPSFVFVGILTGVMALLLPAKYLLAW